MSSPKKRLVQSKSGLRIMYSKDSERSPFELSEPEWIKDNQCEACSSCQISFGFIKRKHHCRRCGKIYCNSCTKSRITLPRMCFLDPVRLCSSCAEKTEQENHFYETDLKCLLTGEKLLMINFSSDSIERLVHCFLSINHHNLVFNGEFTQTIPVIRISTFSSISAPNIDENGNGGLIGLSLQVTGEESLNIQLKVPSDDCTNARVFLESLHKALGMVEEAKAVIGTGK